MLRKLRIDSTVLRYVSGTQSAKYLFLAKEAMEAREATTGCKCSTKTIMRSITILTIILPYLPLMTSKSFNNVSRDEIIGHSIANTNEIFISQWCLIASTISIFTELGYDFLFNKLVAPKTYSLERLLIVSGYLLQYRT